jgi:hypothetical protein
VIELLRAKDKPPGAAAPQADAPLGSKPDTSTS